MINYLTDEYDRKKKKEKRFKIGGSKRIKKKQKWLIGII